MKTLLVSLSSLLVLSACVSRKKHEALQTDYSQLQDRYESVVSSNVGLVVDREYLEGRVASLRMRNAELSSFYEDLVRDFGPAMDRGDVQVVVYPDHTSLVFASEVTFDSNKASLSDRGRKTVQDLARLMRKHSERHFQVQGHTDDRPIASGPYEDNWELGAARALSVIDVLIDADVKPDQVSAASYASTEPLEPNSTKDGREQNRRVEIALRPNMDDLPFHDELIWTAARAEAENNLEDGMRKASSPSRR